MADDDQQTQARRLDWIPSSRPWEGISPSRASRRLSWSLTRGFWSAAWPKRGSTRRASRPWPSTPSRSAQRFGQQVRAGTLDTMSIEFEGLTVVLAPFTPDVMLALLAAPGSVGHPAGQAVEQQVAASR